MPELPDVEVLRRYLDATSLHKEIEEVEVFSRQVLEDISAENLKAALLGRTFESTRRHGKWTFVALDDGGWLVLHFGMTGNLKYFKGMEKEPDHDRLLIGFANGFHLAYDSQRKLGEVELIDQVEEFIEARDLGPDVLDLDLHTFKELLNGRRGMIKSALMDQGLMAGMGNVYSDEILFQAGIHPRTEVNQLADETLQELFHAMRGVLRTAIEHQAKPDQFPESYITRYRGQDGDCPKCGGELEQMDVSGRTAYFCPNHQRLASGQS